MRQDPALPDVFTVADAQRAGLTRSQVETRLRNREWHRLRRGVFCRADTFTKATEEGRHLLNCAAVHAARRESGLVLSHTSAAVVHGMPVPAHLLGTVTATSTPGGGQRPQRSSGLATHVAALPDEDLQVVRGLAVTAPARTLADCLRLLPAEDAVPVVDAALRREDTTRQELEAVLARQSNWPFAAAGRLALALVDPRRESPLESRSAVVMHRHEIPAPEPQVRILDTRGRQVARVDFAWLRWGVVGEADGRVKYSGDAARAVEEEKDRQARLEALGLVVVRWDARHLHGPLPELVRRLRAAFAAGDPARFRGRAA